MTRGLFARGLKTAIAAALMRAGVAAACPQPPQTDRCTLEPVTIPACTDGDSSDLEVSLAAGERASNPAHPELTNYWRVNVLATRNYGWGGTNVCDGMVLFTLDDVTASLATEGESTPLRNVRVTAVEGVENPSAGSSQPYYERHGSGAFCLWASEAVASYSRQVYQVTVEAFDSAGTAHQGRVAVEVVCTTNPSATPAPTSQAVYYQKSTTGSRLLEDFCVHMSTECVAEAALPDTCGEVCQCSCVPTEGNDCGGSGDGGSGGGGSGCTPTESDDCSGSSGGGSGDGGSGSGDGSGDGGSGSGSGDDGSPCVNVEGYVCDASSGATGSSGGGAPVEGGSTPATGGGTGGSGSTEAASEAAPAAETTPRAGCSAFPYSDPSLGALALLGLGLLRRRRNQP